jgi:hypothetical protein
LSKMTKDETVWMNAYCAAISGCANWDQVDQRAAFEIADDSLAIFKRRFSKTPTIESMGVTEWANPITKTK